MIFNGSMNFANERTDADSRLDGLFRTYREACPDPDPSPNFMPELWARIEAREVSTNLFGRMAKALVTAALASSVILGMLVSYQNYQANAYFNQTFVDALTADHVASLEPLHLERISELERQ
jgi:hypothetical protein